MRDEPRGDVVPHLALVGPRGQARRRRARWRVARFARRSAGSAACGAGREVLGGARAVPAPLLDAAHGHAHARAGADEDRDVERAVLLRAEHLLALVDEQRQVGRVLDDQVVDGRALVELLDEGAEAGGGREGAVVERGSGPRTGKTASGPATCGSPRVRDGVIVVIRVQSRLRRRS